MKTSHKGKKTGKLRKPSLRIWLRKPTGPKTQDVRSDGRKAARYSRLSVTRRRNEGGINWGLKKKEGCTSLCSLDPLRPHREGTGTSRKVTGESGTKSAYAQSLGSRS